jgi:hypothetical protein
MKRAGLAALGVTAGFAVYHGQVQTSQLYGRTIHRKREAGRRIALTTTTAPIRARPRRSWRSSIATTRTRRSF